MDWLDAYEDHDRTQDEAKARKLLNVLARKPGTDQQKYRWLLENMATLEAHMERDAPADVNQKSRAWFGMLRSKVLSYYHRDWQRGNLSQQTEYHRAEERPQEAGPRGGGMQRLGDVLPMRYRR